MADIDIMPLRGVSSLAQVGPTGIALNGTATVEQLAQRGMRAVCIVDAAGLNAGVTVEQLAQRGIRAACLVDENGLVGGVSADDLRRRGILPLVSLSSLGLSGSTTTLQLAQRGLDCACLVDENGTATAATFTPASLSGLIGWWDASVTASLTLTGSLVLSMADQSGSGNAAANSSGSLRSLYSATSFNGRPGVTHAGTFLNNSSFPMGTGNTLTVFAAYTLENAAGGSARLINYTATGFTDQNSAKSWTTIARSLGTANPRLFRNGGESVPSNGSYTVPHRLIATISSGGVITTYLDGIAASTGTLAGNWTTTNGVMSIGTDGVNHWNGVVGEIGIATGFTSSTDVAQLDTYLKNHWGL